MTNMVKALVTQQTQTRMAFRWTVDKSLIATVLFTFLTIFIEYLVILYAMSLGTADRTLIIFTWPVTIIISPLFHIVPIAVVIALVACWMYLTKNLVATPSEQRLVSKHAKPAKASQTARKEQKLETTIWQRIRQHQKNVRTAIIVTLFFLFFTLTATVLAYPHIIYSTITNGYQNNPGMINFVSSVNNAIQGFNQAIGPLGGIAVAINNGIRTMSPAISAAGTALGNILAPIATIDPAGKYLAIQNIAVWITVLAVIFYVRYTRKPLRYRRK